jgi:uncharacterized protein (TIGR02246 family)
MRELRCISTLSILIGVLWLSACQREAAVESHSADESAIRAADAGTLKAANEKDVNRAVAAYADDASWLPPNAPIANGKDAIRAGWTAFLSSPGLRIDWQITKLNISRSGDLAYTVYAYELTMQGPDGKTIADHGKDLAVWKKQLDGSWKMIVDTFNSDVPLPPPSKAK